MLRTMKYLTSPLVMAALMSPSTVFAKECKPADVYNEPCRPVKTCPQPDSTELEKCIAKCREEFAPVKSAFAEYTEDAVNFARDTKDTVIRNVQYLRCAPQEVQIGAIIGGGIFGSLFGIRRGLFRKLFYGSIGAGATAAVIFPKEAKQVAKDGYEIAKTYSIIAYNFAVGAQPSDCLPKKPVCPPKKPECSD